MLNHSILYYIRTRHGPADPYRGVWRRAAPRLCCIARHAASCESFHITAERLIPNHIVRYGIMQNNNYAIDNNNSLALKRGHAKGDPTMKSL